MTEFDELSGPGWSLPTSPGQSEGLKPSLPIFLEMAQFRAATGGVYKGQGRNQHELMTRTY